MSWFSIPRGLEHSERQFIFICSVNNFIISNVVMVVCRVLISLHKNSFLVIGPLKIFKHLHNSPQCRTLCSDECFRILDHAPTTFQRKTNAKNLSTFNGSNLLVVIKFVMLIQNFRCNCIHCSVTIVCFFQSAFCYTL